MSLFDRFRDKKPNTASIAKERLQIIVSHERNQRQAPKYLASLQRDILDVVRKYVTVDPDSVQVHITQQDHTSVLELNVNLPN